MIEMRMSSQAGWFEFLSDDNFRDRDLLLSIPGARFNGKLNQFIAPRSWPVCLAARGVFGDKLSLSNDVVEWATDYREKKVDPGLTKRALLTGEGDPKLREYQRAGVDYLATMRKAMLFDPMGTGKTVQAIMTLDRLIQDGEDVFPALVICPNAMKLTWADELAKWLPKASVGVITGTIANKRKVIAQDHDVYIINWESLRTLSRLDGKVSRIKLRRCAVCEPTLAAQTNPQTRCEWCKKELNQIAWRTIIADEAHRAKDKDSKQTRALCALRTTETEFLYPMTGTPISDNPADLWPLLHFIDPASYTSSVKFIERYCDTWTDYWGAMSILGVNRTHAAEFYSAIDPFFRRVPKELVLPDLPEKQYSIRRVQMESKQAKAYEDIRKKSIALLESGVLVTVGALPTDKRLFQLASSYLEVDDAGDVKLANPSCKVTALMELLSESEDSTIVFAESRQLIVLAAAALDSAKISYGLIVGGQTDGQRQAVMRQFQAGDIRVVLSTIKAGGTGITLTKASTVVFLQLTWSAAEMLQAEDRAHRIGSEHQAIQIIDIITAGTCEEAMHEVVRKTKPENIEDVLRDKSLIQKLLGV